MLFSAAQAHHKQTVKKGVLAALAVVCCVLALVFFFGDGIRSLLSGGGVQTEASTSAAAAAQSDFEDAAAVPADDANEWQGTTGTKIPVRSVECSSHQPATGKYGRSFGPEMAIDGNFNTCWMVAGEPTPADHWIQLNFWSKQRVAGIRLLNGNGWDGYYNGEKVENDLFGLNGRIREFSVIFNGGSIAMPYTAKDVREESFGENVFRFNTPIETDYIVLQIHTTYPGSKWTTVACLSEIEAFSE